MKWFLLIFFSRASLALGGLLSLLTSCTHNPSEAPEPASSDNFPPEISRIMRTNCNVAGCHNAASYQISGGGLLMDSWEHLFDGGKNGAVVIPYSPETSSLLYFVNTFPDLGPVPPEVTTRMPLNGTPLSREDYLILKSWIANGAPDKNGNIAFASNAETRQKIYLSHQGCDYLTVIDAEKHVIMRMVPVGKLATIESAYDLKVGSDGNAYISFWASDAIFKVNTQTDSASGILELGTPNSTKLHLSADAKQALVASVYLNKVLGFGTTGIPSPVPYGSAFSMPHGIASNSSFDTFFVTEQKGNMVYRIPRAGTVQKLSIDGNAPSTGTGGPDPYDMLMAPDYSKYFLSCEGSDEIRVMDAHSDALLKVIPVGRKPQSLAISRNPATPYLFVSCEEDTSSIAFYRGSVYIINYNTLEIVRRVTDRYFMPHALAADDRNGVLYIFSRNVDPNGPQPHHNTSVCGGRNGYYSLYDYNKLQPVNDRRYEVTVDPFAADVRFK